MKTMFKASHLGEFDVSLVSVEKETENFVTYKDKHYKYPQRRAKSSEYESFHEYFSDAKREYILRRRKKADALIRQTITIEAQINRAEMMTEPTQ